MLSDGMGTGSRAAVDSAMAAELFSKLIKSATGVTFSDYVQTLRLGKAVSLIESSERALADIASDVGYASYLSFKRAFIRCYNVSPREYREHLLYSKLENT